ncbi:MAG TPA: copper resistance protein CopC [Candidatus Limnocylindria bacterium]|nr:copper resistance protein CopC [Candidatus Limnocylindria bacterium]
MGPLLRAVLGAVVLMLLLPNGARAHAELVSSTPAANASLSEAPDELTLTFTEAIDPASATVRLLDPTQAEVDGVGSVSVDSAATTATVPLPDLEAGTYTVSYQVTSAVDGHVTTGLFAFLVDPTGTEPAPSVPTQAESLSSGPEVVAARWLGLIGALAGFGIVLFWLYSARPAYLRARGASELHAPWGALLLVASASVVGLAVYLTLAARPIIASGGHLGHGESFPLDLAAPFGWTPFAIAMRIALAGGVAGFLVAAARWVAHDEARRRGRDAAPGHDGAWLGAAAVASVVTLGGTSLAGHAAAEGGFPFALVDLLHMLGVGAWLGTVPGLFLLAARSRGTVRAALARHSRLALVAAPLVVLTGLASSPLVVGAQPRELLASGYGNLLIAKVLLFCVAVAIGAVNFFLVRGSSVRRVLTLVGIEMTVGALAVLAAAGMVTGQPAANRAPVLTSSAVGAAHLYATAGQSAVHAAINIPAPGSQLYQVAVSDPQTGDPRTDVQRVILVFGPPPGSELSSTRVELEQADEPWLWSARGAYTPVVGDWELEVIVRRIGELDESTTFPLPVIDPLPPQVVPPRDEGVGVPIPLVLLWSVLPDGGLGWVLALALLAGVVAFSIAQRRTPAPPLAVARAGLVVALVVIGLAVGAREAVAIANRAPPDAAAMQNPLEAGEGSIARGRGLYLANCAVCHGTEGAGDGAVGQVEAPSPGD